MNQDQVILRSFSQTPSIGKNTRVTLMPQQEQQQDFEHGIKPGNHESLKAFIEFRIKQLHNRRFMLLEMQRFRKKDDGVSTTGELPCEDSDQQLCELENIRRELEELLAKKKELEKQRNASKPSANRGHLDPCAPSYKTEGPRGGIYMLPPPPAGAGGSGTGACYRNTIRPSGSRSSGAGAGGSGTGACYRNTIRPSGSSGVSLPNPGVDEVSMLWGGRPHRDPQQGGRSYLDNLLHVRHFRGSFRLLSHPFLQRPVQERATPVSPLPGKDTHLRANVTRRILNNSTGVIRTVKSRSSVLE
ncbi:uncharacterized protein LOC117473884 isoform X1 [Trematomus bernacchii]|uniref:uncharacterized protein LOC117473884 isoform X1 n=1 Tax=Trematomus bernacchii TaxID=40690 RepID=UPI00146C695D|nr:uncharacterized protein LOC117473884 isoform X1 [Trematomus bernacchii]